MSERRLLVSAPVVCLGCGSNWSDQRLAAEKRAGAAILSCCPERKMVRVDAYEDMLAALEKLIEGGWGQTSSEWNDARAAVAKAGAAIANGASQ
jgi:hypothetical protein